MKGTRRRFLGTLLVVPAATEAQRTPEKVPPPTEGAIALDGRAQWTEMLMRIAEPVLANLAANRLKAKMPVECPQGKIEERRKVTHLEALGRTLSGVGSWLSVAEAGATEETARARFADLTIQALTTASDSAAPDHLDFAAGPQNLVDAAFLAIGLARGRKAIWEKLDQTVRERLIASLSSTRRFKPGQNNWLLFSAMVEAFLASVGAEWNAKPIDNAFRAHEQWYRGDGAYGDGPDFHWDYYNSYVIHPFLLQVLDLLAPVTDQWAALRGPILKRALRFAAVQERLIAPDGSYPPLGRSITYRCGAFHHLAAMALRRDLPEGVTPAQVRGALGAVISRTLAAPGTFDPEGWLRIGLVGHQPSLGENYISTGSLYLCTAAFLPLGLSPSDPFWAAPAAPWTSKKAWDGADLRADHAMHS